MSSESENDPRRLEQLSALADGELDEATVLAACSAWRADATVRASWQAYQLIGDVLRSEDLATDPARDAEFLACFRARLAMEPVVLAPPVASEVTRRWGGDAQRSPRAVAAWKASGAVAAGFVAVAGVFMLTRSVTTDPPVAATLARVEAPVSGTSSVETATRAGGVLVSERNVSVGTIDGGLIRDVRLDNYLAAHKQFPGSSAIAVPSTYLRRAAVESTGR